MDGEFDGEHCQSKRRHDGKYQNFEPRLDRQSPDGEERHDNQGGDENYGYRPQRRRHLDHAKRAETEDRHGRDDDSQRPEAHVQKVGQFSPGWQRAVPDHMRDHICDEDSQQSAQDGEQERQCNPGHGGVLGIAFERDRHDQRGEGNVHALLQRL